MQITIADIPITMLRKRVKYLRLRVVRPGVVVLNVPWYCPLATAKAFADSQATWLRQHYVAAPALRPTTVRCLGQTIPVSYQLARVRSVHRDADQLVVSLRPQDHEHLLPRLLQRWYHDQLHDVLAVMVPHWQRTMQTPALTWRIRSMRSRWGSCAPRSGMVTFATGLVHYPHAAIEYVVIHELAHLFHPNHSAAFWDCVTRYCPQWRTQRAALRLLDTTHEE